MTAERSVEWGGPSWLKKLVEPCSGENLSLAFIGESGGMLPQKILKIKYFRLAKNVFPKIFQLIFLVSQKWWNAYFKPLFGKKNESFKNLLKNWEGAIPRPPVLRSPWYDKNCK